jgi:F-box and WD-40 domain protein 1/11
MDRDPILPTGLSSSLQLQGGSYQSGCIAPSLVAQFKLDEGYSDETRSQADNEGNAPVADTMTVPNWVLGHSEANRAGTWRIKRASEMMTS